MQGTSDLRVLADHPSLLDSQPKYHSGQMVAMQGPELSSRARNSKQHVCGLIVGLRVCGLRPMAVQQGAAGQVVPILHQGCLFALLLLLLLVQAPVPNIR